MKHALAVGIPLVTLGVLASIFVSQGADTFMTRARLGTTNEINLLRLKPGARG